MRRLRFFLGLLSLSLAATACGGDSQNNKAITELSDDEVVALCEDLTAIRLSDEDFAQVVCNISGIMAGEQGGDCEATIEACLAEPPEQDPPADCSDAANEPAPDCPDVTVGDLIACQEAQIAQLERGTELTCSDDYAPILNDLPEECASLLEKCPELGQSGEARIVPALSAAAATRDQAIAR